MQECSKFFTSSPFQIDSRNNFANAPSVENTFRNHMLDAIQMFCRRLHHAEQELIDDVGGQSVTVAITMGDVAGGKWLFKNHLFPDIFIFSFRFSTAFRQDGFPLGRGACKKVLMRISISFLNTWLYTFKTIHTKKRTLIYTLRTLPSPSQFPLNFASYYVFAFHVWTKADLSTNI